VKDITIKLSARDTFAFVQYGMIEHARDAIRDLDQANAFGAGIIKVAPANRKGDKDGQQKGGSDFPVKDTPRNGTSRDSGQSRCQRERPEPGYKTKRDAGHDEYRKDGNSRPYRHDGGSGEYHKDDWTGRNQKDSCQGHRKDSGPERRHERSRSPRALAQDSVRVSIRHLPRDMEADELRDIAAKYGNVLEYDLWREGSSKRGWVDYSTRNAANRAIEELDNRRMEDWSLCLEAYIDCMR